MLRMERSILGRGNFREGRVCERQKVVYWLEWDSERDIEEEAGGRS